MSLVVIGAGGHGIVVAEAARSAGHDVAGALDARVATLPPERAGMPVLGADDEFEQFPRDTCFALGIGAWKPRLEWLARIAGAGYALPPVVHASAWVSPSARLGSGTVVLSNASVCAKAELGAGVIVNTNASVDHDCLLEDGVHVCPGARLAGEVVARRGAWIGLAASVVGGVEIGPRAIVGAGAVCLSDVAAEATVVGIPAAPTERSR